jgi:NitT/TauT family transport system substrate-binding protein
MAHEPDASFYEKSGAAFQLADLMSPEGTRAALGTTYPSTTLYFANPYIASHGCEVQRVTHAVLKALRFIEVHDAAAIVAELPPKVGGPDRAAFTRQIMADKQMFGGDGTMDRAAAAGELQAMAAINPAYSRVRLTLTYTNGFVAGSKIPARCR